MTMHTIERIYPKDLNPQNPDDQASLHIHMQRYEFAATHLSGVRILDMACGCGYGTALLAERHPDKQVIGVDIDPEAIAYARQHYQLANLRYECADAEQFREFASKLGLGTWEEPCFQLTAKYRGGDLVATLDSIAQEGINIQFVNAFEAGGQFGILIWVDDADIDSLAKLLSAA